jgi:hypothetical protein
MPPAVTFARCDPQRQISAGTPLRGRAMPRGAHELGFFSDLVQNVIRRRALTLRTGASVGWNSI